MGNIIHVLELFYHLHFKRIDLDCGDSTFFSSGKEHFFLFSYSSSIFFLADVLQTRNVFSPCVFKPHLKCLKDRNVVIDLRPMLLGDTFGNPYDVAALLLLQLQV